MTKFNDTVTKKHFDDTETERAGEGMAQLVERQTPDSMTRCSNPIRSTQNRSEFF